jgi:hypothetical protein
MIHQFLIHSLAWLRLLACVLVVSAAAAAWSPSFAAAQEVLTEEPGEGTDAQYAPPDDPVVDEEVPSEDAISEEPAAEAPAAEEAASGEPAAPAPWDISKPCENYQHPYEADLCQQWRTAEAAEKTAAASARNLGLSRLLMLFGPLATLLMLLMYIPIFMAAMAARRAARGFAPVSARSDSTSEQ